METPPKHPQTAAMFAALLKALDVSASKLAANISTEEERYSQQTIANYVAGKFKPGQELLAAISRRYPAINASWLLTGQGEIFPAGRYNEKPITTLPTEAPEPEPPASPRLQVNTDGEDENYWKGLAQERLRENEFLKELLRGAYGIRPADEEVPTEGLPKKAAGSEHAAEVVTAYQHREIHGLVRYASHATDHKFSWVDAAFVEAAMVPLATQVGQMWLAQG